MKECPVIINAVKMGGVDGDKSMWPSNLECKNGDGCMVEDMNLDAAEGSPQPYKPVNILDPNCAKEMDVGAGFDAVLVTFAPPTATI